ncbi:hypothetical protein GYMLUDRAFT_163025, partial [Collybiopsis luxurians FD-317 M1]
MHQSVPAVFVGRLGRNKNDFWPLLQSGQALDKNLRSTVIGILHDAELDLNELDQEVGKLKLQSTRLELKRETIKSYKAIISSLLSPIRALPNEILQMIFVSVPNQPSLPLLPNYSLPLTISAVCHRWRTVALDSPEIWSYISVELNPKGVLSDELESARTDRALLYLSRSRNYPLTLTFNGS